jgi:hypothetical protein
MSERPSIGLLRGLLPKDKWPHLKKKKAFPTKHPHVNNSNVLMAGVGLDKERVIPTMVGGEKLSLDDAIMVAEKHGLKNYPSFRSPAAATRWAELNHGRITPEGEVDYAPPSLGSILRSRAPQKPAPSQKYFGYEVRGAYQSEDEFFKKNPNVAGMAAEDGRIVLNPYSKNSPQEQASVAKNEAIRLWMRDQKLQPKFNLTDAQKKQFEGTEYGKPSNELHAKHTIIARILTGDPSAKDATPMQKKWAKSVMKRINKQK